MELYDIMKNISRIDIEEELIDAISITRSQLEGLTEERMCKVYSSYLQEELKKRHILARIINTIDLGLNYEHHFILISSNDSNYILADLTFSQFETNTEFDQLLEKGYQYIDNKGLANYLSIINNKDITNQISVDNIFMK